MPTKRQRIRGVPVMVMTDSTTGNARIMASRGSFRSYIGELLCPTLDCLHLHLSDLDQRIEAWEPHRDWPWRTRHRSFDTERAALTWLVERAAARGDL